MKNETKNVNKNSLFCSIFVIFLIFLVWWSPVFKPDFYIFSYNEQLRKIERNFIEKFLLYHTTFTLKPGFSV